MEGSVSDFCGSQAEAYDHGYSLENAWGYRKVSMSLTAISD